MAALLTNKAFSSRLASTAKPAVRARPVVVRAADRVVWLPGMTPPTHLNGDMAGDFGFDPLGLGQNPERMKWFSEAEKLNSRWAMIAVAGIMGQEILGVEGKWYDAGARTYDIPNTPLLAIELSIMGFLETKRYQGFKQTGSSGFINSFPFDPAGINSPIMAVKEIKNGRLAMIAFVGFVGQALTTRTGPIEGLTTHMADPFTKNITGYVTHLPEVLAGTF
jgi:light-harvesting complex I chlorophyll a/b binding protein 5